ncbi:MAG: hydrogenase/urease maturation nickel metallochaperone HypA [archaeon]
MHETVIAMNIIEEAKKHGKVKELHLEIGELAHVPAHELMACLERLVDWELHHREKKARVKCTCGFHGHPTILERGHDSFMIECPSCKGMPELIEGTEIVIKKVVVE